MLHEADNNRWAGLATHYIPSERLEALESRLAEVSTHNFDNVNAILSEFENGPPKGYHFTITPEIQDAIDRYFPFMIYLITESLHSTIFPKS